MRQPVTESDRKLMSRGWHRRHDHWGHWTISVGDKVIRCASTAAALATFIDEPAPLPSMCKHDGIFWPVTSRTPDRTFKCSRCDFHLGFDPQEEARERNLADTVIDPRPNADLENTQYLWDPKEAARMEEQAQRFEVKKHPLLGVVDVFCHGCNRNVHSDDYCDLAGCPLRDTDRAMLPPKSEVEAKLQFSTNYFSNVPSAGDLERLAQEGGWTIIGMVPVLARLQGSPGDSHCEGYYVYCTRTR